MKTSPAFQFYPGDYLRSQRVQLLTLEEEGAYIRLISYCWLHGHIPSDPSALCRLIGKGGSTALATTVAAMFQPGETPGTLIHERLEAERSKQETWRAKSAAGGRKSAQIRSKASTVVQPPLVPKANHRTNQKPTLQSPVCSLQTAVTIAPVARERNPLIDALAVIEGIPLDEIGASGSRLGKALSNIRQSTPEVSAEDIKQRAENYLTHYPQAALTATALASHWGTCHVKNTRTPSRTNSRGFEQANDYKGYRSPSDRLEAGPESVAPVG